MWICLVIFGFIITYFAYRNLIIENFQEKKSDTIETVVLVNSFLNNTFK